jgi:biopolymer transport protein ExbB/TolQ
LATWIVLVEWLARLILFGLMGLSVWSVSIILERRRFFKAYSENGNNDSLFKWIENNQKDELVAWARSTDGWRSNLVQILLTSSNGKSSSTINSDSIERAERLISSQWIRERSALERGLPVLGTLGSTSPFVGLLGTILGIIVSFGELSTGQIDSQKIMYSLAEALILTAVGLGVAIPAVVAFNYYSRRVQEFLREADSIKEALIGQFLGRP